MTNDKHKTEKLTGTAEGGTDMAPASGGEDEGSSSIEGDDSHLNEDQKPTEK